MARHRPVAELAEELRDLVTDYVKQETIEPAKRLGKNFGFSIAAGVLLGGGFVLLLVGVLRLAQTELFDNPPAGDWTSVFPYVITLVVAIAVVLIAVSMMRGSSR